MVGVGGVMPPCLVPRPTHLLSPAAQIHPSRHGTRPLVLLRAGRWQFISDSQVLASRDGTGLKETQGLVPAKAR